MPDFAFVIITLILSAMFSGLEIAFISGSRLQLEIGKDSGVSGRVLAVLAKDPSRFIATTLVGNTLSLSLYGIYIARILEPMLHNHLPVQVNNDVTVFFAQITLSTALVLLTAEFMPKSLFLISPNKILKVFAIPMAIVYFILYVFVFVIVELSKLVITKILRLEFSTGLPAFGLTDLNHFVAQTVENIDEEADHEVDAKILHNALEFKSVKVRECMVPRTEMAAVDIEDGIEALKAAFIESKFSKILIYKDSIDNILGFCQSKQMFKKPEEIKEILKSMIIVPETMLANELLVQFIQNNKSIALVVDEFGGTAGVVTMEDVIEEILGDIQDEYDEEELLEERIDDRTYLFSARHEVDYLNETYHTNLPEGDYETLGGFILHVHKDIPEQGIVIESVRHIFEVVETENNRIESIKMTLAEDDKE